MMYHDNDQLPEELQAPDLITDLKDLYTLNADDAQSLARIQTRLREQRSTPQTTQHTSLTPQVALLTTPAGKGTQMHQYTTEEQKTIPWHQRVNRFAAVLITIVLVGALIATFTLVHRSSTGSQPGTNGSAWKPQPFTWGGEFHLINDTTAWVSTGIPMPGEGEVAGPLLRTADGGKTWQDITPPQIGFNIAQLLNTVNDGVTAWIVEESKNTNSSIHLLRTIDGGKTWQEFALPQAIFVNQLTFTDQNHGWLLGISSTKSPQELFSTIDGGQTWQQVSQAPFKDANPSDSQHATMQFADSQTGWLATLSQTGQPQLYSTHDAGSSWNLLTTPAGVDATRFKFVDAQHGYLIDTPSSTKKSLTFYTTSDGGQTWQGPITILTLDTYFQPTFLNDHQILIADNNKIIVYTLSNGQWVKSSEHEGVQANLIFTTFISSTTGMAIVDYSHPDTFNLTSVSMDHIGLIQTTDGGASWTQVKLSIPTKKVTPYTMAYLTNPGWTYYTTHEGTGTATFTPKDQSQIGNLNPAHLPNLQAKKWLVRFMCSTSVSTAELSFNGQQFSTPDCDQKPVSKVITFDSPQSFQTLKVTIQGHDFWLVAIQACTNDQTCQPDSK